MDSALKYSVLMPLFYKEKIEYLKLSLESMMKQTIKPDEIVLIEDHPISDEMRSTINELAERNDVKINIYPNYELDGKGLAAVLAYGVTKCKNELIARMDTDDISKTNRCEKQLKRFEEKPELDIVGSHIDEFVGDPSNVISQRIVPTTSEAIYEYAKKRSAFNAKRDISADFFTYFTKFII